MPRYLIVIGALAAMVGCNATARGNPAPAGLITTTTAASPKASTKPAQLIGPLVVSKRSEGRPLVVELDQPVRARPAVPRTHTEVAGRAPRPKATQPVVRAAATTSTVDGQRRTSTGYCLRGRMADGRQVHDGAVASRDLPMGSSWRVLDGPLAGRTFTVEDRGPGASFDVWMPTCGQATAYGRRTVSLARA